jgi:hypothetical protein
MKIKYFELDGEKKEFEVGESTVKITAKYWSSHGKERLYFSLANNLGQACWDCKEKEFIKCPNQVGSNIKTRIKEIYDL